MSELMSSLIRIVYQCAPVMNEVSSGFGPCHEDILSFVERLSDSCDSIYRINNFVI